MSKSSHHRSPIPPSQQRARSGGMRALMPSREMKTSRKYRAGQPGIHSTTDRNKRLPQQGGRRALTLHEVHTCTRAHTPLSPPTYTLQRDGRREEGREGGTSQSNHQKPLKLLTPSKLKMESMETRLRGNTFN